MPSIVFLHIFGQNQIQNEKGFLLIIIIISLLTA